MTKSIVDIEPDKFTGQLTFAKPLPDPALISSGQDMAAAMIGTLKKGMHLYGFTGGQFGFSDVIETVLDQTGPAHLCLSIWTASSAGIEKAFGFLSSKRILSLRFLIDRGFKQFKGKAYDKLIDLHGLDCIRTSRIHAKFATIRNDQWHLSIPTSMNLNKNTRLENFQIVEDREFCDFFQQFIDEAFKQIRKVENFELTSSQKLGRIIPDAPNPDASQRKPKKYKW